MMRHFKSYLLTSTALLTLSSAAHAASPVPYVDTSSVWSGAYIGANVGVARQDTTCNSAPQSYGYYSCASYYSSGSSSSGTGFVGGGQLGYDWQDRMFVFGVVGDIDGTSLKTSVSEYSGEISTMGRANWLSSFRGRAGVAISNTLLYFTGGLAVGGFTARDQYESITYSSLNKAVVGWVAGGGIEHKLNKNWSAFAEALYYDFSNVNGSATNPYSASYTYQSQYHFDEMALRIGLNYHF